MEEVIEKKTYNCYGCKKEFSYDSIRYECMCLERRCVCKDCSKIPQKDWLDSVPPEHHLSLIHDLTKEYNDYWDNVEKNAPSWCGMWNEADGNVTFTYREGPYGQTGKEYREWEKENKDEFNKNFRDHNKEYICPKFIGKTCYCCK